MVSFIIGVLGLCAVTSNALALQLVAPDGAEMLGASAGSNQSRKSVEQPGADASQNDSQKVLQNLKLQAGPIATYHDLQTGVNKLQQSISREQETALASIRTRKAAYEQQLFVQRADNQAIANFNAALVRELHSAQQSITNLRNEADVLVQENSKLAHELVTMQKNISTAQEFVKQALEYSANRLDQSPELDVLTELEEADKDAARDQELKAFAGLTDLSVLGLAATAADVPEVIVGRLNSTLGDASAKLEENFAKLSAAFDKLFAEGEARRHELLGRQAELNSTLASKIQYNERLNQAVSHLQASQNDLSQRIRALRVFGMEHLGAGIDAKSVALLQFGTHALPVTDARGNVSEGRQALVGSHARHEVITGMHLQSGTTQTYQDLISGVSNLQSSVETEQRQALHAIRTKKEEYAQLLLKQRAGNEEWASMNAVIAEKLHVLQREVAGLRKQANGLMKDNEKLTRELQTMRRNISMAGEFVTQAVDAAKAQLENAPQLQVLTELASMDREMAHEHELKAFGGVRLSLLHFVGDGDSSAHAPEKILARIETTINDAAAQREESLAKLTETFGHLHAEGQAQRKVLMDKQVELNTTVESTESMKQRLVRAVTHLKSTKAELSSRVDALRAFGRLTLGADTEPALNHNFTKKEHYASKSGKHLAKTERNTTKKYQHALQNSTQLQQADTDQSAAAPDAPKIETFP